MGYRIINLPLIVQSISTFFNESMPTQPLNNKKTRNQDTYTRNTKHNLIVSHEKAPRKGERERDFARTCFLLNRIGRTHHRHV